MTTNEDYYVNFDNINDPEEQAKLKRILDAQKYKTNIISHDEFVAKYSVLFRKNQTITDDIQELAAEYMGRIDPYNPVYIVTNTNYESLDELLSPSNIVLTLPAIWNKLGTVNNLGQDGLNIMQAFNNIVANDIDDRFDRKKQMYSKSLATTIELMTDPAKLEENKRQARAMASEAISKSNQELKVEESGEELSEEFLKQYQGKPNDNNPSGETEEFL